MLFMTTLAPSASSARAAARLARGCGDGAEVLRRAVSRVVDQASSSRRATSAPCLDLLRSRGQLLDGGREHLDRALHLAHERAQAVGHAAQRARHVPELVVAAHLDVAREVAVRDGVGELGRGLARRRRRCRARCAPRRRAPRRAPRAGSARARSRCGASSAAMASSSVGDRRGARGAEVVDHAREAGGHVRVALDLVAHLVVDVPAEHGRAVTERVAGVLLRRERAARRRPGRRRARSRCASSPSRSAAMPLACSSAAASKLLQARSAVAWNCVRRPAARLAASSTG